VAVNGWHEQLINEINDPVTWLTLFSGIFVTCHFVLTVLCLLIDGFFPAGILLTNVAISDMLASLTEWTPLSAQEKDE
jgi:hypothetical protein